MKTQKAAALKRQLDPDTHVQILFTPNVRQVELINALLNTGYWGTTPTEVVRRLIDRQLEQYANGNPIGDLLAK